MKVKPAFLRGELVQFLHKTYPDGIPEQVIARTFYDYNEKDAILSALAYLMEKGYIEKKEVPHPYKEQSYVRWFKITAKGIDLIEENIARDNGVVLLS